MSTCGWCEDAPWRLECALCDPRRRLRLCPACATRWHARGVAQEHEVADLSGVKRPYRDWACEFAGGQTSSKAPSDGSTEPTMNQHEQGKQAEPEYGDAEARDELDLGTSSSPAAEDVSSSASNKSGASKEAETAIELPLEQEGGPIATDSSSGGVSGSIRSKATHLESLVRRFPTNDADAHMALAALTLRAVCMEDALLCAYFNKCEEPECARASTLHRQHKEGVSSDSADTQEDEEAQWALAFAIHLDECVIPTCPFCIRVRLRTNVGSMYVLDRLLFIKRHELQHVADDAPSNISDAAQRGFAVESRRNMLTQQIEKIGRRRQQHMDMSRKLAQLKDQHVLRGFWFPPFRWHLGHDNTPSDALAIQIMEPSTSSSHPGSSVGGTTTITTITDFDGGDQPMPTASEAESAASAAESAAVEATSNETPNVSTEMTADAIDETRDKINMSSETAVTSDATQPDAAADASSSDAVQLEGDVDASAPNESDYIDKLLSAKRTAPDSASALQALDEALALGCAIVDAGFCSPARASRCLLRCQSILTHLQHHVDLEVCTDAMCDAVEYHFAHLSQCQSRSSDVACEYCLRVRERELARAVEALEMKQPEADARVQLVINAMTDSLTDDPPAEREQAIVQLEDELEQAEENKRALAEKLSAERLELRRVRRRLDREGLFSPASAQRLPPHFIKVLK